MKKYEVRFRPLADDDLFSLYEFIADRSGVRIGSGYADRVEAACRALEFAPKRGTPRNDSRGLMDYRL